MKEYKIVEFVEANLLPEDELPYQQFNFSMAILSPLLAQ